MAYIGLEPKPNAISSSSAYGMQLFDFYAGWNVTLRRSYVFHDEHPGGVSHEHALDKLVAWKPTIEARAQTTT